MRNFMANESKFEEKKKRAHQRLLMIELSLILKVAKSTSKTNKKTIPLCKKSNTI